MNKFSIIIFCLLAMAAFAMGVNDAEARSNFWDGQGGCATCHTDDATTCAGCHAHGVHSDAGKDDINVSASTDKATYTPGETVTVSITGGYRPGWVRAILYDENGVEVDRSEGPGCGTGGLDNGCGGGEEFPGPIVLTAPAPSTPGLYTWEASWYGNEYDLGNIGGTTFTGPGWIRDTSNCFENAAGVEQCHGEEIVFTNPFDVMATSECGDGNLDPAEVCDDGAANGSTICGCQTDCTFTATGTGCPDGEFCNGDETCDGVGTCQAGTPPVVDDTVDCTDDSCDEANDVVVNAPNDANCDNGEFCDGSETCDVVNDCQAGTPPCDPATETCDDVGDICEPIGCTSDAECDNGEFCDGAETCDTGTGECLPGTPVDVDDGVGCTDDSCDEVNDVVINAPNDDFCDNGLFCDGSETCDAVNDCQAGTPPVVDDGVGCTDDSCDEANDVVVNAPNDGLCDNGQFCDGSETCDAVNDCQAGTPVDVNDGVGCTDDSCDEVNDVIVNAPNDGLCDNGQFCDGSETCDAVNDCQGGTPPCDPTTETCDEAGDSCEPIGCTSDADCNNGLFCDGAETCNTGTGECVPGTPVDPDDGVGCTDDSCDEVNDVIVHTPNDGLCDNGLFCDGSETCDAVNDCQAGTPPVVDDGVGCTDDSCDEANDVVVNAPNDGFCDNGLFCDGSETCDAVNDCQTGTPVDVDDGVGCTDDSCDEVNDVVVHTPNDGLCDNGQFCDGSETCDAVNDCQAGTPVDVNDGVGCTDDSCDEVNDVIVHTPNDGLCDNGAFCDGSETCDAVNDCQAGTPPCDPTTETCDEAGDSCEPIGCTSDADCNNGLFCDGAETCDVSSGICQDGTPPVVNDGVGCTDDSCDEVNDVVVHAPNDGFCDNGLFCDGSESCDAVNDCQAGTPPVLDDGVGCTDDSCDEVNDVVVNAPNDGFCDNGLFCDGSESCDAVNDCQAGTPPVSDDGVGCTDDSCDEVNDVVVNAPNDGLCDNGQFCDGSETCDAVNDCQAGTPPCDPATETCDEVGDVCEPIGCTSDADCNNGLFCDGAETCNTGTGECVPGTPVDPDDGVGCTDDSCDEINDAVVNAPNDGLCDNGQFCDGSETCDAVNDCQVGTPPVVDDGVGCTDDSCDEVNDVIVNAPNDGLCDNGQFCDGSETCDAVNDCQGGTPPCDPATETCDEIGDICEPIPPVVDLDLVQFRVTKKVSLTHVKSVVLTLVVKNQGSVEGSAVATITGMQNGAMVYDDTLTVTDMVGNGRTKYDDGSVPAILPFEPTVAGDILWRVTMVDGDPDIDEITAVSTVTP